MQCNLIYILSICLLNSKVLKNSCTFPLTPTVRCTGSRRWFAAAAGHGVHLRPGTRLLPRRNGGHARSVVVVVVVYNFFKRTNGYTMDIEALMYSKIYTCKNVNFFVLKMFHKSSLFLYKSCYSTISLNICQNIYLQIYL